jgi:hypothetical protein
MRQFIGSVLILILSIILILNSSIFISGAPIDCRNAARNTSCTSYGCFIVKNASDNIKVIIDGAGFVDLDLKLINISPSTTFSSKYLFFINRSTGYVVAVFTLSGNIGLNGTVYDNQGTYCTPPAGSFVITNRSGNQCVAYIDKNGNFWTRGTICYNSSATS